MVDVINSLGEKELFSSKKVHNSILKSGASEEIANKITKIIEKKVYPGISTFKIYKLIKKNLKKEKESSALKFDLKCAIKKLGPDGFVFEKFMKEILEELDYKVVNNRIIQGKCISYEIDFVAQNKEVEYIGECKYRNLVGDRVDVNVILKSFAVLDDLKNNSTKENIKNIVVTNEKFTKSAIKYASCKKIRLLGWKYPENEGLESIISEKKLYPITILPSFNKNYLEFFAKENVLLAKNLTEEKMALFQKYRISKRYLNKLKQQAKILFD